MSALIRGILRDTVQWAPDPLFGSEIPVAVDGLDLTRYDLRNFYTGQQIQEYADRLKEERRAHLAAFPGLNPQILAAVN